MKPHSRAAPTSIPTHRSFIEM